MPAKTFHAYVLASRTRVLYVGVTSDLAKRIWEHKHKAIPGFTARYNVDRLVLFEETADALAAIAREKQIKAGFVQRRWP
jgi:putative endonuclease